MPAEHEVYFSITDDTRFRAPTMTLTHHGGMDIEELDKSQVATVPVRPADRAQGLRRRQRAVRPRRAEGDHLAAGAAPAEAVGAVPPLRHDDARAQPDPHARRTASGRLTPVACDFKCGFDRDDPRWQRLGPAGAPVRRRLLATSSRRSTSCAPTRARATSTSSTRKGTILAPTFGGGANSLVTEMLGDDAIISSDFGGNPPYEKMKEVARICFKHWLKQTNVLFIIGGKSQQHRHLRDLPRHGRRAARALQPARRRRRSTWWSAAAGRTWCAAWARCATRCEALGLPYRFFGFDCASARSSNYAQAGRRLDEGRRPRARSRRALGMPRPLTDA